MSEQEFLWRLFTVCGPIAAIIAVSWKMSRDLPSQKDFDTLIGRLDELEDKQQASELLIARLEVTIRGLEGAVRDLTRWLREQTKPTCSVGFPHQPNPVTGGPDGN